MSLLVGCYQTCASPDSARPSLLLIQGRKLANDKYSYRLNKYIGFTVTMKQRWSAYEFHHITYLPDKWGGVLPDCELHENGVVVVVMDKVKHPAGDKIICRRASDPDADSENSVPEAITPLNHEEL